MMGSMRWSRPIWRLRAGEAVSARAYRVWRSGRQGAGSWCRSTWGRLPADVNARAYGDYARERAVMVLRQHLAAHHLARLFYDPPDRHAVARVAAVNDFAFARRHVAVANHLGRRIP